MRALGAVRRGPMRTSLSRCVLGFVCALGAACGSSGPEIEEANSAESSGAERERPEPEDSLSVTGLRGTLSQEEIRKALDPRMPKLSRCVQKRSGDIEWLSGSMHLTFLVAVDGSVASVYPTASTMGDRETERCVLEVAKATRFPRPHGGEAEFSWSFEVPLDSDIREPVPWGQAEASSVLATYGSQVTASCGGGVYGITAYIDTDGKVLAAGAATSDEADADKLDCVTQAVRGWTFMSPGSYPAKLQFSLQ